MDAPKTGGELLALLLKRYETDELHTVSLRAGISRTTLENWKDKPATILRKIGRDHWRRIFCPVEEPAASPLAGDPADIQALRAEMAEMRQMMKAFLSLPFHRQNQIAMAGSGRELRRG